jgi:hypothetical protein
MSRVALLIDGSGSFIRAMTTFIRVITGLARRIGPSIVCIRVFMNGISALMEHHEALHASDDPRQATP